MKTDDMLLKLSEGKSYHREELLQIFRQYEDLNETAFRWRLYQMLQEQRLTRVDYNTYVAGRDKSRPTYQAAYSSRALQLEQDISDRFPDLSFVVFESVLLNEFLNHQLAQNTIYLQVEKDAGSYIFNELHQKCAGMVLYKPNKKEFDRYWSADCIVVLELVSQAPLLPTKPHEMAIEKMLVDIIADKSIAATFSPSELPGIYENAVSNYKIETHKLNRYAGRRGKTEIVGKYLKEAM